MLVSGSGTLCSISASMGWKVAISYFRGHHQMFVCRRGGWLVKWHFPSLKLLRSIVSQVFKQSHRSLHKGNSTRIINMHYMLLYAIHNIIWTTTLDVTKPHGSWIHKYPNRTGFAAKHPSHWHREETPRGMQEASWGQRSQKWRSTFQPSIPHDRGGHFLGGRLRMQ